MATRKIKRLPFFTDIEKARLESARILTADDFLTTPLDILMVAMDADYLKIDSLINSVSSVTAPKPRTAFELLNTMSHFPTPLRTFNTFLNGGLPCRTLTEVSGISGSGKTTFCLQLALHASLSRSCGGMERGTLFIDSDSNFSPARLFDLATPFAEKQRISSSSSNNFGPDSPKQSGEDDEFFVSLASKIHVVSVQTASEFQKWIEDAMEEQILERNISLIIIDSIASLVNRSFSTRTTLVDRQLFISKITSKLKKAAETFSLNVVITNSAYSPRTSSSHAHPTSSSDASSTSQPSSSTSASASAASFGSEVTPIVPPAHASSDSARSPRSVSLQPKLGVLFYHFVNTRIVLVETDPSQPTHRICAITKSPVSPPISCLVEMTGSGLVEIGKKGGIRVSGGEEEEEEEASVFANEMEEDDVRWTEDVAAVDRYG
ncbi:DNA repair protein RAD51, RAD51B [Monocercomonoides exilis]|uniref:DNA repair protein RAD51, RAD51B n=1 Tax=Monocercomonoides exilis TaxID=2049356 RepID=UPI00355A2D42|nr:DNA repair protein RAD51, RAD51B [Monocercomonoides exilis]|eukprot:MONOS_10868.1-p1 / transcript=MONOS_10868.1 / gene=MONOS_10868 / organism=Monocercomonoides_exilis_PA203 / gene_product=DNA repair protein RAD51 homolog 2, RAD51B, putative / transcript_product=DNA repair protein RAD51 homolog 2, RAD51B, putative / location=Mono_scaffold00513:19346-21006(-) / protein_length=435 / sequence_SO=supercontig / SO=protein_coding / is_pseudo=false